MWVKPELLKEEEDEKAKGKCANARDKLSKVSLLYDDLAYYNFNLFEMFISLAC